MSTPPHIPYAVLVESPVVGHLRLLGIFHLILGGLAVLMSTLPVIHIVIGTMMLSGSFTTTTPGQPPIPPATGWIFIAMGSIFIVLGYSLSGLMLVTGYKLLKRRSHTFCFVVACIECLFIPFGTILGVLSIVVLSKPESKVLFDAPG